MMDTAVRIACYEIRFLDVPTYSDLHFVVVLRNSDWAKFLLSHAVPKSLRRNAIDCTTKVALSHSPASIVSNNNVPCTLLLAGETSSLFHE